MLTMVVHSHLNSEDCVVEELVGNRRTVVACPHLPREVHRICDFKMYYHAANISILEYSRTILVSEYLILVEFRFRQKTWWLWPKLQIGSAPVSSALDVT